MDLIFILILIVLFILPMVLTTRKQRQRQKAMQELQAGLTPGQKVITAGGMHGVVAATRGNEVDLRVADGSLITFDTMAIVRTPQDVEAAQPQPGAQQVGQEGVAKQPSADEADPFESNSDAYGSDFDTNADGGEPGENRH
ncbi:preprotein translocase subunit YajC [Corynebacterium sp.]|uniref:preprotein translocase subunit YajC n=1 Tax=Corynebacterium sp. TaxID=1720 RepID=UPI0026DC0D00|nr:preprotein translocase subunit YajC [Corynebacterium sp.]MDO5031748.1 preprotein translocase subunit YajC [Corynebacterium sp.]